MRNLNERGNKFEDNFYNTRRYLSNLIFNKENFSKNNEAVLYWTLKQINYDIGVPMEYLEWGNLTSFNKLVDICEKHRKSPSEYEQDLNDRASYLIGLNPSKTNTA